MIQRLSGLFVLFAALFFFSCNNNETGGQDDTTSSADDESNATMYYGGDIITMEGDSVEYAEAVVIKDGKIHFVGAKEEAMVVAGAGHRMIDLAGKTMLPGFIDAHGHLYNAGV